ncbi:MAG: 50S ribosomal protein L4 [Candidatus Liptonbacteria bacterium]
MNADLYNLKHEKVGTVELPDGVFGLHFKNSVVKQVLDAQLANRRIPWAHAKDRSEVRGGGKKPWRQKGTGRARHGSTRSPIWVGGGKAHGPISERSYKVKVNKKMRRTAIAMLLSKKLKDGQLSVLDRLTIDGPKTKMLAAGLRGFLRIPLRKKNFNVLVIPNGEDKAIVRAGRNLPKSKVLGAASLNVYDLMNYQKVILDQSAVNVIVKTYSSEK